MIEVAGLWELGWSAPMTEAIQWEYAMREFGIERLNMTPISGVYKRWIHEYNHTEAILADRSHLTPVFVDENAETELSDFKHPENALYLFGKGTYSPFSSKASEHLSVKINSTQPGLMWPHQALAVVMYHRFNQ